MEKKKTFKEFLKENEQKIKIAAALTVGCIVGAGAVYYGAKDRIKLGNLLEKFDPTDVGMHPDGLRLSKRIYKYASDSKGVFYMSNDTKTFNDLSEMIEVLKNDAKTVGCLDSKIKGVLVFEKR